MLRPYIALFLEFFYPALMPATLEIRFQPLVQDVDSLLFTHELRRQHQDVRIPMLGLQLGYLLIPCQRRTHVREAVGRVRHAQTCTTSEHSALHFARAYRTRDRLGIVRIVVRRIQLLGSDVDRLVSEFLQLVDKPVLEIEPHMIRPHVNLLSHRSFPPLLQRKQRACHPEPRRREGPASAFWDPKAGPSLRALRSG